MIQPEAIYQLKGNDIITMINEAALSARKTVEKYYAENAEEWVDEEEAKRILICGTSKLYRLRNDDEITFTPGYNKSYLKSSLYDYLRRKSNNPK